MYEEMQTNDGEEAATIRMHEELCDRTDKDQRENRISLPYNVIAQALIGMRYFREYYPGREARKAFETDL